MGLTPDVQEDFADQILGWDAVAEQPRDEPVDAHIVSCKQHWHPTFIAAGDTANENLVCRRLMWRDWKCRCAGYC